MDAHTIALIVASWGWDPKAVFALAASVLLYCVGWYRLRARARARTPRTSQVCSYLLSMGILGIALLSPLEVYSDQLFSVHMVEHVLLLELVPPLFWVAHPLPVLLWGLPGPVRRRVGRLFSARSPLRRPLGLASSPTLAASAYLLTVGVWHLPGLYDAAQGEGIVHYMEHASFLAVGLLFWWPVIHPRGKRRLGVVACVPYMLLAAAEGGLIGGVFTFYGHPLYKVYAESNAFGISPLADQQLAVVVMWAVGGLIYLTWAFVLLVLYLLEEDRAVRDHASEDASPTHPAS